MKKLYAKGYFMMLIFVACVGFLLLMYGAHCISNYIQGSELVCISGVILIFLSVLNLLRIFPNTWIKYNKNIIMISRVSSNSENKKKQKKEDKLDIKEIKQYGFSFDMLHQNIEYTHGKNGGLGIDMEMVIVMKDNTKFPIDLMFYTKKQREFLLHYIYTNTGILPTGSLKTHLQL